jgi:hypothetical protein
MCVHLLVVFFAEHKRPHAKAKLRIVLLQIHNVEPMRVSPFYVVHGKVKPLAVVQGVVVEVQVQIVLVVTNSLHFTQVA